MEEKEKEFDFSEITLADEMQEFLGNLDESIEDSEIEDSEEEQQENTNTVAEELQVPESVGNEEEIKSEDATSQQDGSPSSIAKILKSMGVLKSLSDEDIEAIKSSDEISDLLDREVGNRMDSRLKKIDDAIRQEVPNNDIQQYQSLMTTFDQYDKLYTLETKDGENLRRYIINQSLLMRGFSKDDANEFTEQYFNAAKDIEKAKEAIDFMKKTTQKIWDDKLKNKELEKKYALEKEKEEVESLRNNIVEKNEGIFADLGLDKNTREKIFDFISNPTEIINNKPASKLQKAMKEEGAEFTKYVGMFYVLTDGFKNINKLIKDPIRKENKKNIEHLTNVLKNTPIDNGQMKLQSGVSVDNKFNIDWTNLKLV